MSGVKGKSGVYVRTIEYSKSRSVALLGSKLSEETKKKMSLAHKGKLNNGAFKKGFTPWNKGKSGYKSKPCSEERKRKIGEANSRILKGRKQSLERRLKQSQAFKGKRNPQWVDGRTRPEVSIRKSIEYRLWRESVFARDNWTCVTCKTRGCALQADHIKPFATFPELRFAIDNGRTLCIPCHSEVTRQQHIQGLFPKSVETRFKSKQELPALQTNQ